MKRLFTPVRLGFLLLIVFAAGAYFYLAPGEDFIFLPDKARPLAPLVSVEGEEDEGDGGGIYFVTVDVRRATKLEEIFPSIQDGSTLVPEAQVQPPGVDERARRQAELREMARSQKVAAAVAFRELGLPVSVKQKGTRITQVLPRYPAAGKLRDGDVILSADGRPIHSPAELRQVIGRHRPGQRVRLRVRRNGKINALVVATVADREDPSHPVVGILVEQAAEIRLPRKVNIDLGNVGGPSAGLAFALDLLEELGHEVDHGNRIAATGELALDGKVFPVGGLKQKTIGARRAHVDVFVVPAGENASEARRHAGDVRILAVSSFQQALRRLATLPAPS